MHLDKVKFIQWAIDQWVKAEKICTQYDHIWKSGYVRKLETGFEEVFSLMMSGYWPLHPNEVNSVVAEMDRVTDAERLYDRLSLINDEQMLILGNSREGKIRFKRAEDILRETGSYSSERKAEFKEKFEVSKIFTRLGNNIIIQLIFHSGILRSAKLHFEHFGPGACGNCSSIWNSGRTLVQVS